MSKINRIGYNQLTAEQKELAQCIVEWYKHGNKRFLRVGGCAGTGKTTVIANLNTIMKQMINFYPDIAYCAFTGKAAKVMMDKGLEARTVHSLIYQANVHYDEETGFLKHEYTKKEHLDCDLIVVDEASTISAELHRDLISFGIKVLYVGDYAQLPPVGNDINLMEESSLDFKLTKIHRQAENSGIIRLSMAIRNGDEIAYHVTEDTARIRMSEFDKSQLLNVDQVICGKNATRVSFNMMMRKMYGFKSDDPERKDKIIFLYNDKEKDIYNGQQAVVVSVDKTRQGDYKIGFVDIYNKGKGKQFCLAYGGIFNSEKGMQAVKLTRQQYKMKYNFVDFGYVVSCHKSQGSEWPNVVFMDDQFGSWDYSLRQRLLYTAVTRASKKITWIDMFG